MDVLMIQANIEEDEEVTMARFLNGLTNDIRDIVELQEFLKSKVVEFLEMFVVAVIVQNDVVNIF